LTCRLHNILTAAAMANYTTDVRSSCVGNPRLPLVWTEISRRESTSAPAVGFSSPPFPSGAEDDDTACTTVLFPPRRSGTRTGTPQSPLPTPGMMDAVLVNHSPIRAPSDVHRRPRSDIGVVRRPPHTFFSPADPFSLNGVKAPPPPRHHRPRNIFLGSGGATPPGIQMEERQTGMISTTVGRYTTWLLVPLPLHPLGGTQRWTGSGVLSWERKTGSGHPRSRLC